jgi:hypothetical protein
VTPIERFSVHEAPVWKERSDFIINAPLPEAARYEQLWCKQKATDLFEVCCIPFFLYNVALGDIVRTIPSRGKKYILDSVVTPSGRFVFRVHFPDPTDASRESVVQALHDMEALMEWSSASLLAVDARNSQHAQEVADYLYERHRREELIFETGKLL